MMFVNNQLGGVKTEPTEALNKKALAIVTRVREKLTGRDFIHEQELTVPTQVKLLVQQATANENLCQCYIGWYVQIIGCYLLVISYYLLVIKYLLTS